MASKFIVVLCVCVYGSVAFVITVRIDVFVAFCRSWYFPIYSNMTYAIRRDREKICAVIAYC